MRGQILLLPIAMGVVGASRLPAQTLGDVGAAGSISASMNGAGSSGTMAVGSRAAQDARRLGANPYIGGSNPGNTGLTNDPYGSEGRGSGPSPMSPSAMGAGAMGSGGPSIPNPSGLGGSGSPSMAGMAGEAGSAGGMAGGGAAAPVYPKKEALHWGKETGGKFLDSLRSRPTRARGVGRNPRGSGSVASRLSQKQLARLSKAERTRLLRQKYKKPPIGYLSRYLPEDRYKLTSGMWKFVTLEDDRTSYHVNYYFRPDSPRFLSLLAQTPRGSQSRFNRVVGFYSWQDALIAGYRPDPVSKPAPGLELSNIASMAPRAEAAHYAEFLYAGQIPPDEFRRTYAYMLKVRGLINSRPDTRKYLRPTMGQILLAALGEGAVPTSVGGPPRATVTANVGSDGSGSGGSLSGAPGVAPMAPSSMGSPAGAPAGGKGAMRGGLTRSAR